MDHQEAVERGAAERYVLGDLPEAERDQFEEHFFECAECAREVRLCAEVLANLRALMREGDSRPRSWFVRVRESPFAARLAMAAGLCVLVFTAYLSLVRLPALEREIASLRAPQSYAAYFVRPAVRGEDQVLVLPRSAAFLGLAVDLPPGAEHPVYRCELFEDGRRLTAAISVPAPAEPGAALHLLVPRSAVRAGRHTLVLSGVTPGRPQAELARFSFVLKLE